MKCPHCGHAYHKVVDTRASGDVIRRQRECHQCKRRWNTTESRELISLSDARNAAMRGRGEIARAIMQLKVVDKALEELQ